MEVLKELPKKHFILKIVSAFFPNGGIVYEGYPIKY